MNEEHKYCVYKHTTPNNKVYIGITRQKPKRRWGNGKNYASNIYFTNAINKYGWENIKHDILYMGLTKEEAEQKEIEMIAFYKSDERNHGYNIDKGGNATGKTSEETRRKLSISHIGQKGHIVSDEQREQYRISSANNWKNDKIKNKIMSKLIENHGIKVECIETGKVYNTLTEAQRETGANRHYIPICCDDQTKTSNGLHWRYYKNNKINDTTKYRKNNVVNKRKIRQYSLNGKFIKEYESIMSASRETNINISKISRNLKNKGLSKSEYLWKYV